MDANIVVGEIVRLKGRGPTPDVVVTAINGDMATLSWCHVEEVHPISSLERVELQEPYFMRDIPEDATLVDVIRELNARRAAKRASHLGQPLQWFDNLDSGRETAAPFVTS